MDATRADVEFTAEVCQIAIDEGATTINIPDTVGYAMPHEFSAYLARLYELVPALRDVVVSVHCHDDLGLAVANSFAGLQAGAGRSSAPSTGSASAPGNASLEEIVMLLHTRAPDVGLHTAIGHARDRPDLAAGLAADRLPGAAEQGGGRPQRIRARVRHPPGRRAQGAHDLRDHGRDHRRAGCQLDRARQAFGPPRAPAGALGAGLRGVRPGAEHGLQALQGDRGQEEDRDRDGPRGACHRRAARGDRGLLAGVVRRRGLDAAAAPRAGRDQVSRRARSSRARSPATARSTRSSGRSTPPPVWTPACASSGSMRSPAARTRSARRRSCSRSAASSAPARGCRPTSSRPAARAYVRALSNAIRRRSVADEAEAATAESADRVTTP